nr:MAG TPA: hypothetical protein [Caudoviricetes sp.]
MEKGRQGKGERGRVTRKQNESKREADGRENVCLLFCAAWANAELCNKPDNGRNV